MIMHGKHLVSVVWWLLKAFLSWASVMSPIFILDKVRKYKDFTPINDPYFEHDFGSIQFGENTIFWKIDYYDIDLQMHSPDPSDPAVTTRILTIMLAEEYWSQTHTISTQTQQICPIKSQHCHTVELVRLGANTLFEHAVLTRR